MDVVFTPGRRTVTIKLPAEVVGDGLHQVVLLVLEHLHKGFVAAVHPLLLLGHGVGRDITTPIHCHLTVRVVVGEVDHAAVTVCGNRGLRELNLPAKLIAAAVVLKPPAPLQHREQKALSHREIRRTLHVLVASRVYDANPFISHNVHLR